MKGKRIFIKSLVSLFLAFLMIITTTATGFATIINNGKTDLVSTSAGVTLSINLIEDKIGDNYPEHPQYTCVARLGYKKPGVTKFTYVTNGKTIDAMEYDDLCIQIGYNNNTTFNEAAFGLRSIQSPYLNNGEQIDISGFTNRKYSFGPTTIQDDGSQNPFTINVHYTLSQYNSFYKANGGEGDDHNFIKYYGIDHVIPNEAANFFQKSGYHILGFTTNIDGTGTIYKIGDSVSSTSSINLYAKWEPNSTQSYTVNINSNGNGNVSPTSVLAGADPSVDINAYPNTNYEFDRWELSDGVNFAPGYSGNNSTIRILATQNGTVTAYFKRIEVDGPTVILNAIEDTSGEGYPIGPSYAYYPAILKATYGENKIPIESGEKIPRGTYDLNFTINGTGASSSAKVYEIIRIKIGNNEPIVPSTPDKTITVNQQEMNEDTTIEVEYRIRSFNLVYKPGQGTGEEYTDTKYYGVDLQIKDLTSTFSRPGYKFTQYNSKSDGTGTDTWDIGSYYQKNENRNIYPKWVPISSYEVTINAGAFGTINLETNSATYHIDKNQSAMVSIYEEGTYQKITAIPDFDHEFDHWEVTDGNIHFGDINEASTTIYADSAGAIQPIYKERIAEKVTLNVQKSEYAKISIGSTTLEKGSDIVAIEVPRDYPIAISVSEITDHYSFNNWYTSLTPSVSYIDDPNATSTTILVLSNGCTLNTNITENSFHHIQFKNIEPEKSVKIYDDEFLPQTLPIDMPIKAGYTFKGFYETTDGTGSSCYKADGTINKSIYGKKLLTEDLIVYAKWEKISFKVACKHSNGGTLDHTTVTAYIDGTPASIKATPSSGYKFDHWDISEPVRFANESDRTNATTHIYASGNNGTIKAIFVPIEYTLNYNLNGGSYSGTLPETYTIDNSVSLPNNVTKTGTEFVGWYKDQKLTDGPYFETQLGWYGDCTLYAGFTDTLKKINFIRTENKKGQKYPGDDFLYAPANVEILINSIPRGDIGYLPAGIYKVTANITGNNNKSAYQIDGYTVDNTPYACQDKIRTVSFDLKVDGEENVEIQYSIVSYPVTYYQSVEDTSITHSDYKYYGVDYVPIDCSNFFFKPGFHIESYQSSKTGGTTYYPDDKAHPFTSNASLRLYANWVQNDPESVSVNFYAGNYGDLTIKENIFVPSGTNKPIDINNVEPSSIVATPIEGYVFKEWKVEGYAFVDDPNSASTYAYAYAKSSENKITAIYEERTYTITWKNLDGTILLVQELHYGDEQKYPGTTPTIDIPGYTATFRKWLPSPTIIVTRDATHTAQYNMTPKNYKFTLDGNGGIVSGQTQFSIDFDSELPPLENIPEYEGYRFLGFFDDPAEGNQYYNKNGQGIRTWDIPNNATLYAHWALKGKPVYLTTDFTNTPDEHIGLDFTVALSDNNESKVSSSDYLFEDNYNEVPQGDYYLKIKLPKYNDKNIFSNPIVRINDVNVSSFWGETQIWWISNEKITINGDDEISIEYYWKTCALTFAKSVSSEIDTKVFTKYYEIPFTPTADVASLGFSMDDCYFIGYNTPTGEKYNLVYDEDSCSYIIDHPYTSNQNKRFWPIWKNKSEYDGEIYYSLEYNISNEKDFVIDQRPENRYQDIVPGEVIKIDNNVQVQGGTFGGWTSEDTSYSNNMYTAFADASFNGSIIANKITIKYTTNKEDVPIQVLYDGDDILPAGTQVDGGSGMRHNLSITIDEDYRNDYNISSVTSSSDGVSFRYESGIQRIRYRMFSTNSSSFYENMNIEINITRKNACSLYFDNQEMDIKIGYTELNKITTSGNHTDTATITFSSSDDTIATVDDQGYITAHTPGQAEITAHCSDEDSSDAVCFVNVLEPSFIIPDINILFNETVKVEPVPQDVLDTSDFEYEFYPKYPNSTNVRFEGNCVTTKDDAKSSGKNVCQAVCRINNWYSEPFDFNVYIIKPDLKGPSQTTQAFPAGETLAVHYDVTYGNAFEKEIDGIQFPYYTFEIQNPQGYINVDENNVLSSTNLVEHNQLYSEQVTIMYHVNPTLAYKKYYTAQTADIDMINIEYKPMCLGDEQRISCKHPTFSGYSIDVSSTTNGAARVSLNKDKGTIFYYKAAPTLNQAIITIKYKLNGTNSYIGITTAYIDLLPIKIESGPSSSTRYLFYNENEKADIYTLSNPMLSSPGYYEIDQNDFDFTYDYYSDGGNVELNGSELTAKSSGVSQIRVSARLKEKPQCTISSYFTFTAVCDFGDDNTFKPVSISASVAGDISAYTWWRIPKEYRQDDTYVKFVYDTRYISGKEVISKFSDAKIDVIDDHIVFGFPCEIAAKEMSTNITCGCYDKGNNLVSDESTFNLTDNYFCKISNDSYYSNSLKKLQNYGARTQIHFDFIKNKLANKNLSEEDKTISTPAYVYEQTQPYEFTISGEEKGISYYGASLVTESLLKTKIYFTIDKGVSLPACTIDGVSVEPVKAGTASGKTVYYIQTNGDTIKNMAKTNEFKIGEMTVSYSPLSYVHTIAGSETAKETNKNVILALYDFYSSISYFS